ncbi:MAG TPA: serpin family protein, partial [Alphaproteobacteria bacterium]|nr:serpin family protein [Alphaproteobacteria bacterium]
MIAQLGTGAWDDWRGSYEFLKGQVRLPRFTVEWKGSLVGPLAALGMGPAFEHSIADFSALAVGDRAFAIDDVAHSVFVAVDEEAPKRGQRPPSVLPSRATSRPSSSLPTGRSCGP